MGRTDGPYTTAAYKVSAYFPTNPHFPRKKQKQLLTTTIHCLAERVSAREFIWWRSERERGVSLERRGYYVHMTFAAEVEVVSSGFIALK